MTMPSEPAPLKLDVQIAASAVGPVMKLDQPISFWGGIDPASGCITDPRQARNGDCIAGQVLLLPATIGSSSSSAVMLELIANGKAPAALVLGEADAILAIGIVVAREMGYGAIPVLLLPAEQQPAIAEGAQARITEDGTIILR